MEVLEKSSTQNQKRLRGESDLALRGMVGRLGVEPRTY